MFFPCEIKELRESFFIRFVCVQYVISDMNLASIHFAVDEHKQKFKPVTPDGMIEKFISDMTPLVNAISRHI